MELLVLDYISIIFILMSIHVFTHMTVFSWENAFTNSVVKVPIVKLHIFGFLQLR